MSKGSTKQMTVTVLSVALVFGAVYGFQQFRNNMISKMIRGNGMPPQAVSTIIASESDWHPMLKTIGTLRAVQGANLSTESGGLITGIHFRSGATVKAGQLLIELNAAPLQAQLAQLQAAEKLADITLQRDRAQLKIKAISQATVDADQANLDSARAQIKAQQAAIAEKIIRAPFSGRLGLRQVDPGQYLSPGSPIVSLQKLDPIYVEFYVPQGDLPKIHTGMTIQASSDALPGKKLTGTVTAIEPLIDSTTRNVKIRAMLPNHDNKLLPGLYMNIALDQGISHRWITLPSTAIAYNPYGSTVFIVHDKGKAADGKPNLIVEQQFVTTGATRGDQVAVLTGVHAGDVVVTSGQLKLHNEAPVFINNSIQPTNDPHPEVHQE